MKINISFNPDYPEDLEVNILARGYDPRIDAIQAALGEDKKIIGYEGESFFVLEPKDIYYFATEGGKIYAHLKDKKLLIKKRIYELQLALAQNPDFFLINQGALANLKKVEKMSASFNGALSLKFQNGEEEYASRIQTAILKKKLGL